MRLNWFSPLPPARTGIAGYTRQILPALRGGVEITLWTDQTEWDPVLENYAEVRRYYPEQMPWAELNRGDLSIYHIGNNPLFHAAIWQVSHQHPGLVVLHDLHLQDFFASLYRDPWNDHDGYLDEMERHYGLIGRQDAEAFWRREITGEYMSAHYPLTPLAVEKALGALVHSEASLDELTQECPGPIVYVPLPYPASPRPPQDRLETERRRTKGPPYRIIVFGYINVNRRLDALLEALAGLPEREKFRLHIYGQLSDEGEVHSQIRLLGLRDLATVHGFVPESELDEALETSHLAVNLRYPTMGEASVSQLRIWDHALPTLVTRVGWYANLPESAVAFVRPKYEIKDIQEHLRAFLADPGLFARMGENGRHILQEHHAPGAYVQALVDLAAEVVCLRPYVASCDLVRRLSAEITLWANLPTPTLGASLWERSLAERHPKDAAPKQLKRFERKQAAASTAISEATAKLLDDFHRQRDAMVEVIHQVVAAQADSLHLV
jgi:glycosyltransferase involved in cell wall biosynthesis